MSTRLLTFGTFDTTHAAHAAFLRKCERFADSVIIGLRSDAMVRKLRGHDPVFPFYQRAGLLRELGYEVRNSNEAGCELVREISPDVLAIGSDWARRDWLGRLQLTQDELDSRKITLIYIPYTPGVSTTSLKRLLGRATV